VPFADALARVSELETLVASTVPAAAPAPSGSFATALEAASAPAPPAAAPAGSVVSAAESQVGQAEQPPGSNDGPAIAGYRTAVAGAQPGEPWCAYFASWACAQAGVPLGDAGTGLGSVSAISSWAQRTGRFVPPGTTPQPGDLMLFGDRHVGIVEAVNPDGSLTTVEGNYANAVSRVHRLPSEATGYVRPAA
jgi:hypothetical protein